jgi:hypothetical protein
MKPFIFETVDPEGNPEEENNGSACPHSFLRQAFGQILKDDVDSFSSTSDISFMTDIYLIIAKELKRHKH